MPNRLPKRAKALDWDELRTVNALARHGSLSGAARALALDATTVARRLATAETRSGVVFFERVGNAFVPTEKVRAIAEELASMETTALAIEARLSATPDTRGVVRLAVTDAFASYVLCAELAELQRALPGIELELVTGTAVADLLRREADLALRFARPTQPDLVARRLTPLRWSLYGSDAYLASRVRPDPEAGLVGHRVIRWGGPPLRPTVTAWLEAHSSRAETALSATSLHVMIEACAHGQGLALLPGPMALGRGLSRAIDVTIDTTEHWLVMHRHTKQLPRVRAVADALHAHLHARRERLGSI